MQATRPFLYLLFTVLYIAISPAALAQQRREELPPLSAEASVLGERVTLAAEERLKPPTRKAEVLEPLRKPEAPPEVERPFFVHAIVIEGNTLVRREDLHPLIQPYENREITLSAARELAGKIEDEYRRRGYVTTIVYVPPQKVENDVLRISVAEGKIGKAHVEGNQFYSTKQILRYWRLKKGEPLKYQALTSSIQRMNENPDREARAIMRPGEETGETDIYIEVKDRWPGHVGTQYDNQGVESTGRRRYGFNVQHNNFLFPDAILVSGTYVGKDFGALYNQYLVPVTPYGTQAIGGFSFSRVAPKREFKGSDIHSNSLIYSASLRQALWETERFSSSGQLGFEIKDSRSKSVIGTSRRDRLRVLRPGFDLRWNKFGGITSLSNSFGFGLKGLGATSANNPVSGRDGAPPDFIAYNASISHMRLMPFSTRMKLNLAFQLTFDKLLPQEELYMGGANTIRGYPEGDYLADQGIIFNLDYYVPLFFIPEDWKLPFSKNSIREDVEWIFFIDQGYGRLRGASQFEVRDRYLLGVGTGLRIRLARHLYARIEFAHAAGQEPLTESDHNRLHFQLQMDV